MSRYDDDIEGFGTDEIDIRRPTVDDYYAGFWLRFAAAIIDWIILLIPNMFIAFVFAAVMHQAGISADTVRAFTNAIGFAIGLVYFAVQESSAAQATLGKRAVGIIVTDMEGRPLTFAHAMSRYFAKILSVCTCFIGYIMAAFTDRKQALHDIVAKTLVVRKEPVGH